MSTPAWLKTAVFYQIYPQSFLDTNGDGIGDLPGIIAKLDYLQSLGVTALWLNPVFQSPFGDAGYDVSDFLRVAPRYGTNADLRRLFREAHKRGLRVVLDLVAGHTSIDHPWFQASRADASPKNHYKDHYVWTDSVWQQPEERNWVFGAGPRDGNFLVNFFHFQPALNYGYARPDPAKPWQQPVTAPGPRAVRAELKKIMRHWLDAGCDGFRVDMASSLVKGPPDSAELRALWQEIRTELAADYPEAVLVSEWGHPTQAIRAGFHIDFIIHFGEPAYNALFGTWSPVNGDARDPHVFFERAGGGDIRAFLDNYQQHLRATRGRGYISLPTGNHDFPRLSRGRTPAELRCAHALLLTLPGVPFLYYGDEIGLPYREDLPPKEGSYRYRTGTRTPMAWTPARNRGFSTAPAKKLYLPLDPSPASPDVATQESDPDSHLHFIRTLLALRRAHPALGNDGQFRPLYAEKNQYPFIYERRQGPERFLIAVNPRATPAEAPLTLPARTRPTLRLGQATLTRQTRTWQATLPPMSFALWQL